MEAALAKSDVDRREDREVLETKVTLLGRSASNLRQFREMESTLGVQVDYNVVHLRTSLVQLFVLLLQNFEKVVQMIELKRFGGSPNGYPFAPLVNIGEGR
jgi:hypothetical protein